MIDTSFVGHLEDPVLLSGMVLGGSLAMATGYHVMCGLASASETLSGQAHGAKNPQALAATLQRSLAVCTAAAVPITALWWNAEPILTALGQAPEIAAGAARYLQLTLPALYSYMVFDCVDKHLLAQNVVTPGVAITAVSTGLTPLFCWYFVNHLNLGLEGAAYAYVASQATSTALSLGYLSWRSHSMALQGSPETVDLAPTTAALTNWMPYLSLAVPATLMACMEGWAVEVLIFLSGNMENADVAVGVTGLCLQFSTLVWLSAASISSATSTRIANALGKGDAAGARRLAFTSLGLALVTQSLIGLAAFSYRSDLVGLMTSQQEVLELAGAVMPVLALCFVFDGQNAVLSSVLRGAGRQWLGAGCNLVGWWGVGVPLAYYLALPCHMGVQGLWGGFATASALQACVQWAVVSRLDWDVEVQRAKEMLVSTTGGSEKPKNGHGQANGHGHGRVEESDDDDDGGMGPGMGVRSEPAVVAATAAAATAAGARAGAGLPGRAAASAAACVLTAARVDAIRRRRDVGSRAGAPRR
ncbi:hypothetical protein HYH03_015413 [Edaphochlamys debaryana]|uniref:Protein DETOXIFICATION n=1 Tax=Edaphochlamys debaryana TaxID=47281 RepID=A0A836BR57_9CHLO|nr:hypothetical protein HYH03_015413 [Edaphochlamys debaryana]|eukprot:KAG2485830.1 hypothetical protein HYH03_015413 [Edaphochlamys debaryana]